MCSFLIKLYDCFFFHRRNEGPCLEVVLWRPRASILTGTSIVSSPSSSSDEEDSEAHMSNPCQRRATPFENINNHTKPKTNGTTATAGASTSSADFYSCFTSNTAVSSPDSGVSVSPPLIAATTGDSSVPSGVTAGMDSDDDDMAFSSAASQAADSPFINNPFSLFYPQNDFNNFSESSVEKSSRELPNLSVAAPGIALAPLLPGNVNNSFSIRSANKTGNSIPINTFLDDSDLPSAASMYTNSWVGENNNRCTVTDLEAAQQIISIGHLPPLPDDDDDMDL